MTLPSNTLAHRRAPIGTSKGRTDAGNDNSVEAMHPQPTHLAQVSYLLAVLAVYFGSGDTRGLVKMKLRGKFCKLARRGRDA
ncbi:hypothetical protein PG990_012956 [Apiospora arundinis]